jgi:hypothetical protein
MWWLVIFGARTPAAANHRVHGTSQCTATSLSSLGVNHISDPNEWQCCTSCLSCGVMGSRNGRRVLPLSSLEIVIVSALM